MPDDSVQIAIEAVDNASAELAKIGKSIGDLGDASDRASKQISTIDSAMEAIIQQERAADVMQKAAVAVGLLSDEEKNAIVVAAELRRTQEEQAQVAATVAKSESELQDVLSRGGKAVKDYADQFSDLSAKYRAGEMSAEDYAKSLEGIKDASEKAIGNQRGLVQSLVDVKAGIDIAGQMLDKLKQAWDFAKEGAENQRIAESFDRTAKGIGANADEIVKKLDEAAHGTVDDEELMQASTRALTLGVAKNGDDLVNVMKLARAAALQFGGDAGQAFETINYAIGNLAPRALKQFGIIVNLKDASEAYAKANGLVASSLTEEQQRQALLNAVLEQGAKNFGDLANSATTTAEKMKKFETQVANLWDTVKEGAADAFLPLLDDIELLSKLLNGNASELDQTRAAYELAASTFGATSQIAEGLKKHIDDLEKSQTALAQTTGEKTVRAGMEQIRALGELKTSIFDLNQGIRNQADVYATLDTAMDKTTAKSALLASQQKMVAEDMALLKTAMAGQLQSEFQSFNNKQDDLATKAAKVREELEKLEASQGKAATGTKKHAMSAAELTLANLQLAKAQADLDKETAKGTLTAEQIAAAQEKLALNKGKLEGATKKEIEGSKQLTAAQVALKDAQAQLSANTDPMKQAELAVKVEHLKESLNGASGAVTNYIDNSKRIKELQGQYDEINKEIQANVAEHEKATKTILFGYAEQQLAADGLNETEAKALDALAVKWGLKSQEDVTAMQNIRTAAANLAKDGSIAEFTATVGANLDNVNADYAKTQGAIENVGKAQSAIDFLPPAQVKVDADIKPAEQSVKELAQSLLSWQPIEVKVKLVTAEEAKAVAGDTLAERRAQVAKTSDETVNAVKAIGGASNTAIAAVGAAATTTTNYVKTVADGTETRFNLLANHILTKFTGTTTDVTNAFATMSTRAVGDLTDVYNYVDRLPTRKDFIYNIIVTGKNNIPAPIHGAQYGADFIVPNNPHGGSGDYFPVMAAPGERVVVQTKAQQATGQGAARGGDTINYIYNNRITDTLAATMLMEQQRRERLARSNARMGVR